MPAHIYVRVGNYAKAVSNKTGAKVCNQDAELFKNKDIDAILIASVTSTHADYMRSDTIGESIATTIGVVT